MNLPGAREYTQATGQPVTPALVNALQDCIIGAKHPSLPYAIGALNFQMVTGGTATLDQENDLWTFGAVSKLVAPLRVPIGTRIHQLTWYYNRGNAGTVTLALKRRDNTAAHAAVGAAIDSVADNATPNAWQNNVRTPDHVIAAGFTYWLFVQCDNVANIFGGVIINPDRL